MSEVFKQNSINLVLSALAILTVGAVFGVLLFWVGGLLIVPAIALWFQFKFALGNFIQRLIIAITPWLVICGSGLFLASKTAELNDRQMNILFFEMPLFSVLAGCIVVSSWFFIKKLWNMKKRQT